MRTGAVKRQGSKVKVQATLAPILMPAVSASIVRYPAMRRAPYVPALPVKACVVSLTETLSAVMCYVPSVVRREALVPSVKPCSYGADRRESASEFVAPRQSYSQSRLVRSAIVQPMRAAIGKRAPHYDAMPLSILRSKLRTDGAISAVEGTESLLPTSDTYSYSTAPLVPFTGYAGASPLAPLAVTLTRETDRVGKRGQLLADRVTRKVIYAPHPRKGESVRYLW